MRLAFQVEQDILKRAAERYSDGARYTIRCERAVGSGAYICGLLRNEQPVAGVFGEGERPRAAALDLEDKLKA